MNVLDAKTINTQNSLEIYVDRMNHVMVTDLHIPTEENPYFDLKIGIKYYRLRNQNYYDSDINYFWLRIDLEKNSVFLLEPDTQSLFAIKDEEEREATQELIGEWLINTLMFKHSIREIINQKKAENITSEVEIRPILRTIELLEKTLELSTEDILKATVEKAS
ncbi:hypothetical protein R4Z09_10720 [Niallia oryzisoli]|uniref:AraC family transcriptional regulator n=1 Tax=Niallia oryzisoli TaxID=1737571 RepID=A0ABZ2CN60_9BACI